MGTSLSSSSSPPNMPHCNGWSREALANGTSYLAVARAGSGTIQTLLQQPGGGSVPHDHGCRLARPVALDAYVFPASTRPRQGLQALLSG